MPKESGTGENMTTRKQPMKVYFTKAIPTISPDGLVESYIYTMPAHAIHLSYIEHLDISETLKLELKNRYRNLFIGFPIRCASDLASAIHRMWGVEIESHRIEPLFVVRNMLVNGVWSGVPKVDVDVLIKLHGGYETVPVDSRHKVCAEMFMDVGDFYHVIKKYPLVRGAENEIYGKGKPLRQTGVAHV
jgi:hypothetical protein